MKIEQEVTNEIPHPEYYMPFLQRDNNGKMKIEAALERAWKNRDFEIDKYWSRATYFWAFIASTFVGYVAVLNSDTIKKDFIELPFLMNCLGLIFSVAWVLVNLGSKKWQENWEKHIDMLEDLVTGPIYKTVLNKASYSVSKINLIVSQFIMVVWALLLIKNIAPWVLRTSPIELKMNPCVFSLWKCLFFLATLLTVLYMLSKRDKVKKEKITKTGPISFNRRYNKEENGQ